MKNRAKHIEITAIIMCLLAMGILSLIGCKTYKPTDYMSWGDRDVEIGAYDSAIRCYNWILDEFPSSPEAQIAREKIAAAKEKMAEMDLGKKESIATNVYAAAQREALEDDFGFTTEWDDNNIKVITKYLSKSKKGVRIPANMQIAKIEQQAFHRNENIIIVIIPDSVKSIGFQAFEGCTSLASITIPDSVTHIGVMAFYNCASLTSITIPKNITRIEKGVFAGCTSLTGITIPNSVTSIEAEAFAGCTSLTSITIPNSVTSIGAEAFAGCTSLTSITIPNSITRIREGTFARSGLTGITIPNSVTSIEELAFSYSGLKSITIPSSVTIIEEKTFRDCYNLTSITIPSSVTSIGNRAFENCVILGSVTIGSGVTSIGSGAFSGCTYLENVTFQSKIASNKLGGVVIYHDRKKDEFNKYDSPFPGDLREKYCANDGVPGTYIRIAGNERWRKQ